MKHTKDITGIEAEEKHARWMGDRYVVTGAGTGNEWYSTDGDTWRDQHGNPVADTTFGECRIVLCGGPRDGEAVA